LSLADLPEDVTDIDLKVVAIAGDALADPSLPTRIPVVVGIQAPLEIDIGPYTSTNPMFPAVTHGGRLFMPIDLWPSSEVLVFAANGSPLPGLPLSKVGLVNTSRAGFCPVTNTLLLCETTGRLQ